MISVWVHTAPERWSKYFTIVDLLAVSFRRSGKTQIKLKIALVSD